MGGCCFHKLPTLEMDKMVQIGLLLMDKVIIIIGGGRRIDRIPA